MRHASASTKALLSLLVILAFWVAIAVIARCQLTKQTILNSILDAGVGSACRFMHFVGRFSTCWVDKAREFWRGMGNEQRAVLPLEALFAFLTDGTEVEIVERDATTHVGRLAGFDEYMNITVDAGGRRYMLKGDCVCAVAARK